MSSFPLPGQSLHHDKSSTTTVVATTDDEVVEAELFDDDPFTTIASRKIGALDFFPSPSSPANNNKNNSKSNNSKKKSKHQSKSTIVTRNIQIMKSMSSDDDDDDDEFDVDLNVVDSTTSASMSSFANPPPPPPPVSHKQQQKERQQQRGKKKSRTHRNNNSKSSSGSRSTTFTTNFSDETSDYQTEGETTVEDHGGRRYVTSVSTASRTYDDYDDDEEEDDHRNDEDVYESDYYSHNDNDGVSGEEEERGEETEEEEYQTEGEFTEGTVTEGEFTEPDDDDIDEDDSSLATGNSFNTLLFQVENNDLSLRDIVLDTTSMDHDTAEDLGRYLSHNTYVTTIRLSCKRLDCKEGQQRKRSVLSTILSGIQQHNTSIESVEIENTYISYQLAHSLSKLCARKSNLKNVAFIQCQFVGSALAIVCLGMQHSQSIKNLIFQSCDLGDHHNGGDGGDVDDGSSYNIEIIASALPLMNLSSLSLVDVNFPTRECLHYLLTHVEQAKELKLLDLSQNTLSADCISLISRSIRGQNQVSRLILSDCSLDNACVKELTVGLRGYDPLTSLDVSKNKQISDRGAGQIKELLEANSKITKLHVNGCSFSEGSLDALENALRYNNSFLKTFVSVSTGQQIFDVLDAVANLGAPGGGGEADDEEEEEDMRREGRVGGDRRRRAARGGGRQQSSSSSIRTPKKTNKTLRAADVGSATPPPKQDEMRALFRAPPPPPPDSSSVRKKDGDNSVSSPPLQREVNLSPLLPGKSPRTTRPQSVTNDPPSVRRNGNAPVPSQLQQFDDEVAFDMSSSHSVQSGAKYSSPRNNGNAPLPKEFFSSPAVGSQNRYSSSPPRPSSKNSQVAPTTPQYEFSQTNSSHSGVFTPTRQDTRSAKYMAQRKNAVQQSPKIDRVIQQLSPSRRDTARSPKVRSPRGSGSSAGMVKKIML
jgi:hypothetical protein